MDFLSFYGLIRRGQDYLERGEAASLAQHFWAVSLIAQAYVAWYPLTRIATGIAGLREGWGNLRILTILLCILIIFSLTWSIIWTGRNPTAAYFDLLTRYWQFGVGALLGLWFAGERRAVIPVALAAPLSWVGLGLILSCGVVIGVTAAFPGYAALWPVTAAALILLASHEGQHGNAGRLLAARPLASLGKYSFGIYLWHWPLYVVVLQLTGEMPSIAIGAAIIGISILLAYLSQNLADAIVAVGGRRLRPGAVALVCVAGLLGLAAVSHRGHQLLGQSHYVATLLQMPLIFGSLAEIRPGPLTARSDTPASYARGCHQVYTSADILRCDFGPADAAKVKFLVGGSHSTHWEPALKVVAEDRDWRIVSITKSDCTFASPKDEDLHTSEGYHPTCATWNQALIETILAERPDAVITLATRPIFAEGDRWDLRNISDVIGERVPMGYLEHFHTLVAAGIQVVAIRDTPWMGHDVPACVFAHRFVDPDTCGRPRSAVLDDQALSAELARIPAGVAYVDMTDAFCDDTICGVVRDGLLIYTDSHHISATYARHIGPLLADRIEAAIASADLDT